ncbi:MAG: ribbon-helix-helix domain-containing protein [Dermabacter sp.]|uniref:ribbon-helix-helix domain-containing protein n=1 Tax=Dermabacter hominis TaxID=36740 RepID=UPI0021A7A515|nr:ribbon-helix-helix domain-containing protein [Dermabacter hominis]MCT1716478.1 ribbon-helix-helix domain-containing protein [Dermabacter hominis]MCT1789962.1 ribbon-helix-helix domain-containing protein [Dermabacter hominis]MDU4692695.1 ribbon-helix-helix domain-containing protein [Dermabacter sp.]
MTVQISLRLPDDLVEFLDRSVSTGAASSRADIVSVALEREKRRQAALADAAIVNAEGPQDDLDSLVEWTAHHASFED